MHQFEKSPKRRTTTASATYEVAFESTDGRFKLLQGDCLQVMAGFDDSSFDLIFADPPYFLSNGGVTCKSGQMVSVNKGKWDKSQGWLANYHFTKAWLSQCQRLLTSNGSIWVSGTSHVIHIVGNAMLELGYKILNDITWVKPNPPPNLSCRYFTHATETIIWARKNERAKHYFNYSLMRQANNNKQMTSVWSFKAPAREEKTFGKHPTQKPLALMERIILSASQPGAKILDPFSGSATTGLVSWKEKRNYVGIERETEFNKLAAKRFRELHRKLKQNC